MPTTGQLSLRVNRWEPFVHVFRFEGQNFTGAAFISQVRLTRDAAGSPLVNLATVGSVGTEGITLVSVANEDIDFGGDVGVVNVPVSTVSMRINEATVEALPLPAELGEDVPLYWDMQITPSGGNKYRALEGEFVVAAGVTH